MVDHCIVLRNSFASECFTNIADEDYILARAAYRMGLMNHFLWSSLQAVEKYLKAILLFNGKSTCGLRHRIDKAWKQVARLTKLRIRLTKEQQNLVKQLSRFGSNRYLERGAYTTGDELQVLDSLVWSLRRYCQALDVEFQAGGKKRNWLEPTLQALTSPYYEAHPSKLHLPTTGILERVLRKRSRDPARQALVWQNAYFASRRGKKILIRSHSVVPPHFRDKRYFECLKELVDFPADVRAHFASKP